MEELEALFEHEGVRTASVSIDDFYLTFADQQALARVPSPNLGFFQGSRVLVHLRHWQVQQGARERCRTWVTACCMACLADVLCTLCCFPHHPTKYKPNRVPRAQANPGNRLLQVRGNAGTHDVALGGATLRALAAAGSGAGAPLCAWCRGLPHALTSIKSGGLGAW